MRHNSNVNSLQCFPGKFEKKEQYFIYNGNALIADIGGYLGLLLGFSVYSIFKYFIEAKIWAVISKHFKNVVKKKPKHIKNHV